MLVAEQLPGTLFLACSVTRGTFGDVFRTAGTGRGKAVLVTLSELRRCLPSYSDFRQLWTPAENFELSARLLPDSRIAFERVERKFRLVSYFAPSRSAPKPQTRSRGSGECERSSEGTLRAPRARSALAEPRSSCRAAPHG